jgi:hypothetical protein
LLQDDRGNQGTYSTMRRIVPFLGSSVQLVEQTGVRRRPSRGRRGVDPLIPRHRWLLVLQSLITLVRDWALVETMGLQTSGTGAAPKDILTSAYVSLSGCNPGPAVSEPTGAWLESIRGVAPTAHTLLYSPSRHQQVAMRSFYSVEQTQMQPRHSLREASRNEWH